MIPDLMAQAMTEKTKRASWDETWCAVATAMSLRSSCDRALVGAVVVRDNRVVSVGYNGPASGDPADTRERCSSWCNRAKMKQLDSQTPYGYACPSIHAEANALLYASRADTEGSTLYVTQAPCAECAKLISGSGVFRVVIYGALAAHRPDPTPYLFSCGIPVDILAAT